jgi:hypothetical protein
MVDGDDHRRRLVIDDAGSRELGGRGPRLLRHGRKCRWLRPELPPQLSGEGAQLFRPGRDGHVVSPACGVAETRRPGHGDCAEDGHAGEQECEERYMSLFHFSDARRR